MQKCDICDSTNNVVAGRWIFYCPQHKDIDRQKTLDNELRGDDSDLDYMLDNADTFAELLV